MEATVAKHKQSVFFTEVQGLVDQLGDNTKKCLSDGYHTFDQLYQHRIELYLALCRTITMLLPDNRDSNIWRSKVHSDGNSYAGWFILGIGKDKNEQITYHLPISRWHECNFAEILDVAPDYDGHTSEDVLNRLKEIY